MTNQTPGLASETGRRIVCAALRRRNGEIVCGPRHYDNTMRAQITDGKGSELNWVNAEQGFIDQFGKFLSREDAYLVAQLANQFNGPMKARTGILYSEHLY